MPSTLRFLSGTNGFVPAATGMVVQFIRKPEKFKINSYTQVVPADGPVFLYSYRDRDNSVRVMNVDESVWHDGNSRKHQTRHNQGRWRSESGRTTRRNLSFELGWQAQNTAQGWKPLAVESAEHATQMMTLRTKLVLDILDTAANWATGHTADANTLNGGAGKWDTASDDPNSPSYLAIWKAIAEGVRRVDLDTNGMVSSEDLKLVISPDAAIKMAQAPEIQNYLRESPFAMAQVKGETANMNQFWGLPTHYKGIEICVENASVVTERPKASGTEAALDVKRVYLKSKTSALLVSRPGAIDGDPGTPAFSTVQLWHYEDLMRVAAFDDPEDELTRGHVSEQVVPLLIANVAGCRISNIL